MSTIFSTEELHARTADVLATVERGEEVIVERDGRAVARILPARDGGGVPPPQETPWKGAVPEGRQAIPGARRLGWAEGMVWVSDDFDDPISEEDLVGDDHATHFDG